MGMDSLTAMELKTLLEASLAVPLPATLAFDYATVETMVEYLLTEKLPMIRPPALDPTEADGPPSRLESTAPCSNASRRRRWNRSSSRSWSGYERRSGKAVFRPAGADRRALISDTHGEERGTVHGHDPRRDDAPSPLNSVLFLALERRRPGSTS